MYEYRTRPYEHQREYARVAEGRRAFALLCDYGTGKSKMIVDEISQLWEAGEVDTVVITAAKGSYANWADEFVKHMPRRVWADTMVHVWTGADSSRARHERRELHTFRGLSILVVNIEALSMSRTAKLYTRAFMGRCSSGRSRRMVVVDESTLIKNHEAKRTEELVVLAGASEYRRIATGNPTPHSPLDLWGQFLFLGAGSCRSMLGYGSFYAFRARYAVLEEKYVGGGRKVQVPVAYRNLDELTRLVSQHSFRARKEDCLDLPPKVYQMRTIEMTPEQRRLYEDVRKSAWAELEGGENISASQVMSQMIKLHQILCGQVTDDEGVVHDVPTSRMPALLEAVEESGRQTIVWCAYRSNVAAVSRELRREFGEDSVAEFHGGVSAADRMVSVRRFEEGRAHFMVATPHAGGRGNTWNAAKTTVFFSNAWDLELRLNAEDRNHRIGQTTSVNYVDIVVPGSLDERIVLSLREKIDISTLINGDNWRQWVV